MKKRITGWHAAAALIAFFGVVIAVNLTMAVYATSTFGGVVVENSYVASQKYNGWLKAAERQRQLGWTIVPTLDAGRHVMVHHDLGPVDTSGFARHPLGREPDVPLSFTAVDGGLISKEQLPAGRWKIHLLVRKGADEARIIETLQ